MDAMPQQSSHGSAIDQLASLLTEQAQCDAKAIERARRVSEQTGQRLDATLIRLGLLSEAALAQAYAHLLNLPVTTPERYPVSAPLFPERLTPQFLRSVHALPIAIENNQLVVALTDPLDPYPPAAILAATGMPVVVEVAVPLELEAALDRLYPSGSPDQAVSAAKEDTSIEEDAERLKDLASEAPVIRLVNQIIQRAVETHASDIHIEPFEDRLRIRYRYDGILHEADAPPARLAAAIVSRIKIMARLDIAERRLPQDGRIRLAIRGQDVDFRVSTMPSMHGETVVLRVLDRSAVTFDYAKLGLPAEIIAQLKAALQLPDGLVLVTGPTGSGKTTTLYTGLLGLNTVARKVVTIEDPIEYELPGIDQTQVRPHIGLTFASLLRSFVRQDPNVIMVGEIRDSETVQIAIQAALVGRLVLSTLHTNSAVASISRLRDMGAEDYLLAAVLRGILAQRLVRRLCQSCKRVAEAPPAIIDRFDLTRFSNAGTIALSYPVGCPQCRNTGYHGRFAIAEYLRPDRAMERSIASHADQAELEQSAVRAGMLPMFDCGLQAALRGETSIDEVVQSVRVGV